MHQNKAYRKSVSKHPKAEAETYPPKGLYGLWRTRIVSENLQKYGNHSRHSCQNRRGLDVRKRGMLYSIHYLCLVLVVEMPLRRTRRSCIGRSTSDAPVGTKKARYSYAFAFSGAVQGQTRDAVHLKAL